MKNVSLNEGAPCDFKTLAPINKTVGEFVKLIAGADAQICVQIWKENKALIKQAEEKSHGKNKSDSFVKTWTVSTNLLDELVQSERLNEVYKRGCGVHWKPNIGGMKESEITTITAQFVESDDVPLEEQWQAIMSAPLLPTAVVCTAKSLHTYYKVNQEASSIELFKTVQQQLISYFNGDTSRLSANANSRLPGFYHCKEEPIMVNIIYWNPQNVYEQEEIHRAFPAVDAPGKDSAVRNSDKQLHKGIDNMLESCAFFEYCKKHEHLSYLEWFGMLNILSFLEGGREIAHAYSNHDSRYDESETDRVFSNIEETSPGPTSCEKLEEYGFSCPKRKDGTCSCRSPILYALKPMDYDMLEEKIATINTEGEQDKIARGKDFVLKHLFNVEPKEAKLLIKEIAVRLHLTDAETKTLIGLQKEEYKRTQSKIKGVVKKYERGLGAWYVLEANGVKLAPLKLAKHLLSKEQAFFLHDDFHLYANGVYNREDEKVARKIITTYLDENSANTRQVEDVLSLWKNEASLREEDVDSNTNIINLENGLYDAVTGELKPHTPEYKSTIRIHASYNPEATAPMFNRFLATVLPDEDQQHLMMQIIGYLLLKLNVAQKLFILFGPGGTGKTSMLNVIEALLGTENVSSVPLQSLSKEFALANLVGKLVNISGDLPARKFEETSEVKSIVGNDSLNINRKFRDGFNTKLYTRLISSCNSIPPAYCDQSSGWYRRFLILEFNHVIPPEERDPSLSDKLISERDGILLMALTALKALMEDVKGHKPYSFATTNTNDKLLREYIRDSNSAVAFAEDCLETGIGEEFYITNEALALAYDNYCIDEGIETKMSIKTLGKRIKEMHPNIERGVKRGGVRGVLGIRLKKETATKNSTDVCDDLPA